MPKEELYIRWNANCRGVIIEHKHIKPAIKVIWWLDELLSIVGIWEYYRSHETVAVQWHIPIASEKW
jgi:hypothetical protein